MTRILQQTTRQISGRGPLHFTSQSHKSVLHSDKSQHKKGMMSKSSNMPPDQTNHTHFMALAIQQAHLDTSPPASGKFRVGAILVNSTTGEVLSSGHSLELPGDMPDDPGSTHAEQCCFIKIAQLHDLPIACAEKYIVDVLPEQTVLYTTMAPCNKRSVRGARTCCERIAVLKGKVKRVYVGMGHLREECGVGGGDEGRKMLEREGVEVVEVREMSEACYQAAIGDGASGR